MVGRHRGAPGDPDDIAVRHAFRVRVALVMAAVSLASAYVTFIAADRSAEASDLDALASQQWAEEQQADQQIDAQISQDQILTARLDTTQNAYSTAMSAAQAAAATDPHRAGELLLQSQEAASLSAQLYPFFRAAAPTASTDGLVYDADAARQVLRIQDARLYRASSGLTRERAAAAADLSGRTAAAIVLLVAALFILTLAHIAGVARGVALFWIGSAVALVGVGWFVSLDVFVGVPLLVFVVLSVGVLLLARRPRVRAWLTGLEGAAPSSDAVPDRPGTMAQAEPSSRPASTFDRTVAVIIGVATLLGAGVGYLHSQAARTAEQYAWVANDDGVESIGSLRAAEEALGVQVSDYEEALVQHVLSWNTAQRALNAAVADDEALAIQLTQDAATLAHSAERIETRSALAPELGSTGIAGLDTLNALRADVWHDSARITAQQDAANAASRNWGERAGWYLSVLAWLAVAVYLLGLALAFKDGRARLVFTTIGVLLVLLALGQSVRAITAPVPVAAARAAEASEAYARGVVALARNDGEAAETAFTRALELRPDFGIASRERASAILLRGSSEGLGLKSGFTDRAVDQAIADLESARAHGADTAGVMINLGAMLFHRSVNTGSAADMQASVDATRAGLALGEDAGASAEHPHVNAIVGRLNLALSLLGQGDVDGARREYGVAALQIHTLPAYLRPYLVSAGLAPMDLVSADPHPPTAEEIRDLKDAVVSVAYGVSGVLDAEISDVRAEVFPAQVQWRASIRNFDPQKDHVAAQWYRLDRGVGEWGPLPVLSGPLTLGAADTGGQFYSDGPGSYWGNSSATLAYDVPPSCVRPGRYRVELYFNGQLAGSAEAESPAAQASYTAVVARDVGVAMCSPSGWTQSGTPGISRTVTSADGLHSISVLRVQQPLVADSELLSAAIDRAVRTGGGGAGGVPSLDGLLAAVEDGAVARATVFGGKPALWRTYTGEQGTVVFAAVKLLSGTVLVARAAGPGSWSIEDEAAQLLGSTIPTSP